LCLLAEETSTEVFGANKYSKLLEGDFGRCKAARRRFFSLSLISGVGNGPTAFLVMSGQVSSVFGQVSGSNSGQLVSFGQISFYFFYTEKISKN
jgi:hypothetical protein